MTDRYAWDIFCAVVDNYGDIGVTWRLARQLQNEGYGPVRLWVDDLHSFAHICPGLEPALAEQVQQGVLIRHWPAVFPTDVQPARVVIEAFACTLPAPFQTAMQALPPPRWLNLEYLSAESWVEDCHGLVSPQAGISKFFFFPGFSDKTGGLLCERGLIAARERWQQDQQQINAYWAALGLPPPGAHELRISLFTYENPAVEQLVRGWRQSPTPVTLLVPQGRVWPDVLRGAGLTTGQAGDLRQVDNLTLKLLPLTDQDGYDRLLWSCDVNLVRGEDSLVRALWAGRPFLWHIYPQDGDTHLHKLDCFLARYTAGLPAATAAWVFALSHAFNRGEDAAACWQDWPLHQAHWQTRARRWPEELLAGGDLVTRLMQFLERPL